MIYTETIIEIISYGTKKGSIPSIMNEYDAIQEKGHGEKGRTEYINEIGYKKHDLNVLKQEESRFEKEKL